MIMVRKRTNIELDTNLVNEAMEVFGKKTIKDAVHHALETSIKVQKRRNFLKFKGKVDWEGNLDEMRSS
jgi:Arc/MetJ family transcription regulator